MSEKVLGVIGGVGPLSTAYFMEVVINMTDVKSDQEHINMIVLNDTKIPDRTEYILDNSKENPVPYMQEDAKKLKQMGADIIVTPCNTAHYFYNELSSATDLPFINMIDETALELKSIGCKKAGLLATAGTITSRIFQTALEKQGIIPVIPSKENCQKIMDIIYKSIKANKQINSKDFNDAVDELREKGCDRIILGCTELSLLKREYSLDDYFIDALEVLAKRSIEACGKKVKL